MDWINPKDRLPEEEELVLVVFEGTTTVGYTTYNGKWSVLDNINHEEPIEYGVNVDLWMELPKAP